MKNENTFKIHQDKMKSENTLNKHQDKWTLKHF